MEVMKLEDIVAQTTSPHVEGIDVKSEEGDSDDSSDDSVAQSNKKQKLPILYGRPKSGRVWKERKSRYGIICTVEPPNFYPEAYRSIFQPHNLFLELDRIEFVSHRRSLIGFNEGCRTCHDTNTLVSDTLLMVGGVLLNDLIRV
jgi:hypothetical protein